MKTGWIVLLIALFVYGLSGIYVVRGNEQAVVRRFGRLLKTSDGTVAVTGSGLHYDLPWPFSQVNRINLNEIRTLTIGISESDEFVESAFLQAVDPQRRSQFLTGDKNILNLQIGVQYRISEAAPDAYLFSAESSEGALRMLVESVAADFVSRSGVDFVHPLGLGKLRDMLTERCRALVYEYGIGVDIEEVAINSVYPPIRVKADFLDVSNARADKERSINEASAYAEQQLSLAKLEEQRERDAAHAFQRDAVESARGQADSFASIIQELRSQEKSGTQSYEQAKQLALQRMYLETMQDILRKVSAKVLLDSGKPVDLTIFRESEK